MCNTPIKYHKNNAFCKIFILICVYGGEELFIRRRLFGLRQLKHVLGFTHYDDVVVLVKDVVRAGHWTQRIVVLYPYDIYVIFLTYIEGEYAFPDPGFYDRDLVERVFARQLDIVEYIFSVVSHRESLGYFAFGIDDFVCAYHHEKFRLTVVLSLRYDERRAELLKQRGYLERSLKVFAYRDQADVEVIYSERAKHAFLAAVSYLRIGEYRGEVIDDLFVHIDDHNVVAKLEHLYCKTSAETAHAYNKNRFHSDSHSLSAR